MPLVKPLSPENNSEVKELAKFFNETLGFCPNSVLTMQIRPDIALAFINLNKAVMENKGRVTSSLKRMIAWVSSNATGCRYCQAHAIRAAERGFSISFLRNNFAPTNPPNMVTKATVTKGFSKVLNVFRMALRFAPCSIIGVAKAETISLIEPVISKFALYIGFIFRT